MKGCDTTWASETRYESIYDARAHREAPEICVEVLSPRNTPEEMQEKKALYFAAGAEEVWFCKVDGTMRFFFDPESEANPHSLRCPEFPQSIED